jgi:hypothetical protein
MTTSLQVYLSHDDRRRTRDPVRTQRSPRALPIKRELVELAAVERINNLLDRFDLVRVTAVGWSNLLCVLERV